jgi:23S rRNA (uracil1939-C5)-methyltransferase
LRLTIDKLIYGGDGLARLPDAAIPDAAQGPPARGKAVFVPFTLAGEAIEAAITEEKAGFARAHLERVVEASPYRIAPQCPYFQQCGGCHYQHTTYEQQLAIKTQILEETLRRQAKLELSAPIQVHSAEPWRYRNRSRFQVRSNPEFVAGFFRVASHEIQPVEHCPISSPLINRALAALWELGRAGKVPQAAREIEFFANADDSRLMAELILDGSVAADKRITTGEALTDRLRDKLPVLTSAYVFPTAAARTAKAPNPEPPDWALGGGEFRYAIGAEAVLRVSGGSFFQVNRFLIDKLVELVAAGRSGELALDLYAGVGLFTCTLARSFRHTIAVESSLSSAADLKYNALPNTKVIRTTVEEFLAGKRRHGTPTLIVVDPPRSGLGDRVARALAQSDAHRITYVSCDPATLARDLVSLRTGGYRVEQVHLVDLFPQTFHIETVVHLTR